MKKKEKQLKAVKNIHTYNIIYWIQIITIKYCFIFRSLRNITTDEQKLKASIRNRIFWQDLHHELYFNLNNKCSLFSGRDLSYFEYV